MGGDDAPALGHPRPALHLSAQLARSPSAAEERGGGGEVAPEGGDDRTLEIAGEAGRGSVLAKGQDLGRTVEAFGRPVADDAGVLPEQLVKNRNVIAGERGLVAAEGSDDLGQRVGGR